MDKFQEQQLRTKILGRIAKRQRFEARMWLTFWGFMALISSIGTLSALQYTIQELYLSNFTQYVSLIGTDTGTLFTYFREFVLSLTESLPIFGITALLFATLILLLSIRFAARDTKLNYLFI